MSRVNVLHLSDLHLASKKLNEQDDLLRAFFNDIEWISRTHLKPDFIAFSGDLAADADEPGVYSLAIEKFISPLLEASKIDSKNLFICPGNHDAQRSIIEKQGDLIKSLDSTFSAEEQDSLFVNHDLISSLDEKFEKFRRFRSDIQNRKPIYESAEISLYEHSDFRTIVGCLNTALMTTGGLIRPDQNKLLLSENSIKDLEKMIPENYKFLSIGHHPDDWLTPACREDVLPRYFSRSFAHLFGHMHQSDPKSIISLSGKTTFDQGGALYIGRKRYNGYSIVSYGIEHEHIEINFRSYFHKRHCFDVGINVAEDGKFFSSSESRSYWKKNGYNFDEGEFFDLIVSSIYPRLAEEFKFALYDKPLAQVFVEPTLSTEPEQNFGSKTARQISFLNCEQLIESKCNYIIFSKREFGKTTLLKYLALRMVESDEFCGTTIPVYLNFMELKVGRDQIKKHIRGAMQCDLPSSMTLDSLLFYGKITLIIDDYHPERTKESNQLTSFMKEFPNLRYIVCLDNEVQEMLGNILTPELPLHFEKIYIHSLGRRKMRRLVQNWMNQPSQETESILNRIVSDVVHINVPLTAVTGSIFLTIIERNKDFKPLNRAVLVQQFVETLLGKFSLDSAYRDTFDFRNKEHYLGYISEHMARSDRYIVPIDVMRKWTREYRESFLIKMSIDETIEIFVHSRIWSRKREDGEDVIQFRYRAFLEYFIAKRMTDETKFKDFVLDESRYLQFVNEIEYLSGIGRNDETLIELLAERLDRIDSDLRREADWHPELSLFDVFTVPKGSETRVAEAVERALGLPALSDDERDEIMEHEIPRDVGQRQEVFRPILDNVGSKWLAALTLLSRLVRNSELVSGDVKRKHLYTILTKWSEFTFHVMMIAPNLAKQRKLLINGVHYIVTFGEKLSDKEMLQKLYYAIPESTANSVLINVGSEKLEQALARPLTKDYDIKTEPAIVSYFRVGLLADLKVGDFPKYLGALTERLRESHFLLQILLYKIRYLAAISNESDLQHLMRALQPIIKTISRGKATSINNQISIEIERIKRNRLQIQYAQSQK